MKIVLALAVLCGLFLSGESRCAVSSCPVVNETCDGYTGQLTCLESEKTDCSGIGDFPQKTLIKTEIALVTHQKHSTCSGYMMKASVPIMLLSLVLVYLKRK